METTQSISRRKPQRRRKSVTPPPVPTVTAYHCPCCGTPSQEFTFDLLEAGFFLRMTCGTCGFPVESLICSSSADHARA